MKIQFGCGGNRLPGWQNHDAEVDIRKPLPYGDAVADLVFAEHVVEHVAPADAWRFFTEVLRILRSGGVFRIAVPSIERVALLADKEYLAWLAKSGFGEATLRSAVENQIVNHGHLALWSEPLLKCCLEAVGFRAATPWPVHASGYPELRGIHGHGKVIGDRNNSIETITMEAVK